METAISISTSSTSLEGTAEYDFMERKPMDQVEFDECFKCNDLKSENKFVVMTTNLLRRFYEPYRSCTDFWRSVLSFFPILNWLPKYNIYNNLLADAVGGFMVGIMHVPQGIAYAILAGVPPVVGLYTSFFPVLAYMLFGTSRHASIGSFAVVALMTGQAVYRITDANQNVDASVTNISNVSHMVMDKYEAIEVATALTLSIGLIQILVAILGLDFVTTYFSEQLVAGFTTGAAVHVFVTQLKDITGIYGTPRRFGFGNAILRASDIIFEINRTNIATVIVSTLAITMLFIGKKIINPRVQKYSPVPIPFELLVVIFGAIFSALLSLNVDYKVAIVGYIPTGVPSPSLPRLTLLRYLVKDAISIFVVIMAVHISMAKLLAKHCKYTIDAKQEFFATGFTSVIASFFPVFPSCCSLARTLVNASAGTKTQLFAVFSSLFIFFVIQFGGSWLRTLPMCILASIIIVALLEMFSKLKQLPKLWEISKIDWAIWVVAFLTTSCIDVMDGLTIAIIFALLTTVFRQQWPSWQVLARLNGTTEFRDIKRYQEVHFIQDVCIVRFDAPLLFTNVERFREMVDTVTNEWIRSKHDSHSSEESSHTTLEDEKTLVYRKAEKFLIIDCSGIVYIDVMGVNCLKEIHNDLQEKSIHVLFASAKAAVRELFCNSGLHSTVSKTNFFPTINDAVYFANHRR